MCVDGPLVLIITSRRSGRWILPKGWLKPNRSAQATAAEEAFEEAGVKGAVEHTSVGFYSYKKRLHTFASVTCTLEVYPLEVTHQRLVWREKDQRAQAWLPALDAADRMSDAQLAEIVVGFAKRRHCAD